MLQAILPIISLIVKALLGLFIEEGAKPDEAVIADRDRALAERLRRRLRSYKSDSCSNG